MNLVGIIVDSEGDHGLTACGNSAQPGRDLAAAAAFVWQVSESGDGGLDLVQSARGGLRAGIVDQPAYDRVEFIRNRRMEPYAIAHSSRAACSRARAAGNASSAET